MGSFWRIAMILMCAFNLVYCLVLAFVGDDPGVIAAGAGVAWLLLLRENVDG